MGDGTGLGVAIEMMMHFGLGYENTRNENGEPLLSKRELARQRRAMKEVLSQVSSLNELAAVMKYGMPQLWPFNEGRPWDAVDLRDNFIKARAAMQSKRRTGRLPMNEEVGLG